MKLAFGIGGDPFIGDNINTDPQDTGFLVRLGAPGLGQDGGRDADILRCKGAVRSWYVKQGHCQKNAAQQRGEIGKNTSSTHFHDYCPESLYAGLATNILRRGLVTNTY